MALDAYNVADFADDDGLFVTSLLGVEYSDWCALEATSRAMKSAVHRMHPVLRQEILDWGESIGCSTVQDLCKTITTDCTESHLSLCWALLGSSQHIPIDEDSRVEENTLLHMALTSRGVAAARFVAFLLTRPGAPAAAAATNKLWQTALHFCARHGRTKPARRILLNFKGVDVNALDHYETSPLLEAVRQENSMMVRTLLARGADANVFVANCHGHGDTPLIVAVRLKNVDITRQLANFPGIDFHQSSMIGCPFGKTALEFASEGTELRQVLIEAMGARSASDAMNFVTSQKASDSWQRRQSSFDASTSVGSPQRFPSEMSFHIDRSNSNAWDIGGNWVAA